MRPVSIILKTWNALPHVRLCVGTLLRHTDGPFELIVIDNGSRPDTVSFLRGLVAAGLVEDRPERRGPYPARPRVRLVENAENLGPGAANRQGVALAEHELVCLMDSDVLVPTGWLPRLVNEFERHEGVKLLAPLLYHPIIPHPFDEANSTDAWFRVKQELPRLAPLQQFYAYSRGLSIDEFDELICSTAGPVLLRGRSPEESPSTPANDAAEALVLPTYPPDFIGTACALLDRGFVEGVGGVADPRFAGYGSEDVDLCWRIGEAGGQAARTTTVYVHHFHHASLADNAADPAEALLVANRILYDKWRERLIGLCQAELAAGGSLREYLARHFIFGPLARHTTFLADLAAATRGAEVPEEIIWRPAGM